MTDERTSILFLCIRNSARSQMAEGLLRAAAPAVESLSAGVEAGSVRPEAVAVSRGHRDGVFDGASDRAD